MKSITSKMIMILLTCIAGANHAIEGNPSIAKERLLKELQELKENLQPLTFSHQFANNMDTIIMSVYEGVPFTNAVVKKAMRDVGRLYLVTGWHDTTTANKELSSFYSSLADFGYEQ